MKLLKSFLKDNRGVTSIEVAVATPMLAVLALSCVEVTSFVLFNQKIDRAVTAMGDLTAQARGLTSADLENLYDAAEYIMRPFDLNQNGIVIVSSVSPDNDQNPYVNWQWKSQDAESLFGNVNQTATLPDGFVVRSGESIIISEVFASYDPVIFGQFFSTQPYYQYSVFRPRFDGLTTLE